MNFYLLTKVIEELSKLVTGARVERVFQSNGILHLILGRSGRKFILLLSPDRVQPRLHLVTVKPSAEGMTNSFVLYLRSHIVSGRVKDISLLNEDRLVSIRFAKQATEYSLIFELFGSAANLIFCDSSSEILSVFYPIPPAEHTARTLLPGLSYQTPMRNLQGKSSAGEVISNELEMGKSPNKAAEQYYNRLIEKEADDALRRELRRRLKTALAKSERLRNALSQDLQSAEQYEEYRQHGDLILANLDGIKQGMEQAALKGYDGVTMTVPLDPTRSPAQNAEQYFKKYKKAKAGRNIISTRLSQVNDELSDLQSIRLGLDEAEDHTALAAVRAELAMRGYVNAEAGKGFTRSEKVSPVYRRVDVLGWEVLVGKSAAGNDYITTRMSRPNDLWLHAEGLPGSHVIVRNPESRDIPSEVFLKAASLAAYYSKGRNSGKVSVTYTRAGLVRKPKGAKPGLVVLTDRKSIMVKPQSG